MRLLVMWHWTLARRKSVPVVLFAAVQVGDALHFLLGQLKSEQIKIFPDMLRIG